MSQNKQIKPGILIFWAQIVQNYTICEERKKFFHNLLFSTVSQHVVFEVALGVKALSAIIFGADEGFFTAMDTHVHHVVLADAEYFSALRIGAPEWLSTLVQVHMLVETSLPGENLGAAFELTLEFLINFIFLCSFLSAPSPSLRLAHRQLLCDRILFLIHAGIASISLRSSSFSQNRLSNFRLALGH